MISPLYRSLLSIPFTSVLLLLLFSSCRKEAPQPSNRIRAIKTFTVSERASGVPRKFPGVIEAADTSALSFEVPGNVQGVRVEVGNMVKKGQVLAVLDKRDFLLHVESAKADLARERALQTQRQKNFERVQNIFKKDPGGP